MAGQALDIYGRSTVQFLGEQCLLMSYSLGAAALLP